MTKDPEDPGTGEVAVDPTRTQVYGGTEPAAPASEIVEHLCVEVVGGPMDGLRIRVETPALSIGRDASNDLALVMDPLASAFHARIERESRHCWLMDLDSRNGVYLGDQRMWKRARISAGTTFVVGQTRLEFNPR